jgi:outer membrane protein TolC
MEPVTLVLRLDRLEDVLAAFPSTTVISPENHPSVKVFQTQADAQRLSAESSRATRLPRVQLFAKSSMDYPNGPNLETIHQNTVGVTLSMPFFEGGRIKGESQERESLAKSAEHRFANARENLLREVKKARNRLDATRSQQAILKESSNESQRLARLSYASYRAGRSSFLEVQSANLKVLEARILEAQNQVQALMQLAILESLAGEK